MSLNDASVGAALDLVARLNGFHQGSNAFSDFVITCRGYRWSVHRLVLSLHSTVLAKACSGEFKEAVQAEIDLSDDHPACIAALNQFLYALDYRAQFDDLFAGCGITPLMFHVMVSVLADKYDIPSLAKISTSKFQEALRDMNGSSAIELAQAAIAAYKVPAATESIRRVIVEEIVAGNGLLVKDSIKQAMLAYPQLSFDVATLSAERMEKGVKLLPSWGHGTCFCCPSCKTSVLAVATYSPTANWACGFSEHEMKGHVWLNHQV